MLSFANPLFLWGLLGLAVPILVHLINRDLFRPLHFPSLRFILRGKLPVERKRRIRDWVLLALRLLLFAAIIGALARPQWQSTALPSSESEETEIVLLIDASASISGWNGWEKSLSKAEKILSENPSARFGLILSTNRPEIVESLTNDRNRIQNLLKESNPQPVAGDHREALREAVRLFENQNSSKKLAIISDFQQSDWSPGLFPELPPNIETSWISIADPKRENLAILNARALPLPDGGRQIVAEIRNFSESEADRKLTLTAGNQTSERNISLNPGETRSFTFILEEKNSSRAELSLDSDSFELDDRYFLWLDRPPAIPVLIIAPISEEPEKAEELFFLSRALSTETESEWLRFSTQFSEPADLSADSLKNVQTLFLLGAAPYLSDSQWNLLHEHLANGGRILFTPGKAPARQTTLLSRQNLIELEFDGINGTDRQNPRPHHIDSILPDSSLDHLFQDESARTLSHVSFYQYTRLKTDEKSADILLRTSNNDPLLIERSVNGGTVLTTAFPFETSWTDLPLSTAFLPMIRELVAGDLPPDHGIAHFDTGTEISEIAAKLDLQTDDPAFSSIDPLKTGINLVGNIPVILNHPRSESTTATSSIADLQTALTPHHSSNPTSETAAKTASSNEKSLPLWPWFAAAAALLFILEMPLAAFLRRQKSSAKNLPSTSAGAASTS